MTQATIQKLNTINAQFYAQIGQYFHNSRQYSWTGWEEVWNFIIKNDLEIKTILDIGCGNGRFYQFLQDKIQLLCHQGNSFVQTNPFHILQNEFKYYGLDNSSFLLDKAREKIYKNASFHSFDLLNENISLFLTKAYIEKVSLFTLFGVIHHIPSYNKRRELLHEMKSKLNPEGCIILSIWKFRDDPKYQDTFTDWKSLGIDEQDLEQGDFILPWNRGETAYRYCHYMSAEEENRLFAEVGLTVQNEFYSDGKSGKLNKYVILSQ